MGSITLTKTSVSCVLVKKMYVTCLIAHLAQGGPKVLLALAHESQYRSASKYLPQNITRILGL